MPWSGVAPNQTFTRTDGTRTGTQVWQEADGAGVDIVTQDHDLHDQDLADGVASALKKDGGNAPTANLPMAGYRHTGASDADQRDQYSTVRQHATDAGAYCTAGGTANAITLTTGFSLSVVPVGARFTFKAAATNTAAATVTVDGLAGVGISRNGSGIALSGGEIQQNAFYTIRRDTSDYKLTVGTATAGSADIYARIIPVGTVLPWPTATLPAGYLDCDGGAVSRTTYAELFAAIGTSYGAGDGSTTFNKPDYRGEFLRGWANGSTNDPDRASRTNRGDGTTGDNPGTKQLSQNISHSHPASSSSTTSTSVSGTISGQGAGVLTWNGGTNTPAAGSGQPGIASAATSLLFSGSATSTTGTSTSIVASGGAEGRPRNVSVRWIILALPQQAAAGTLGVSGFSYTFDAATTDADPGAGKLRLNNAAPASANAIYISETDGYAAPLGAAIQALPVNTMVYIFKVGQPGTFALYTMGATATDAGAYDKLTSLTYVAHNGTFLTGDPLAVIPFRAGATGSTGPQGADGGIRWAFDSSTTMGDPGSGELRLNNATLGSVTEFAISANNGESGNPDISDWVAGWDDSTTTGNRGQIIIRKATATQNYVVLNLTSAVTDNTTWLTATASVAASNGSFTAADPLLVSFHRTGDKGLDGAGSGTVTSVTAGGGLSASGVGGSGGSVTVTGTITAVQPVNAQGGTTYTVVTGDNGKLMTFSNGSAVAVTLPQATGTFGSGWHADVINKGVGTVTITPTTSTIGGSTTLELETNESARIVSDGTDYQVVLGHVLPGSSGAGSPSVPQGRLSLSTGIPVMTATVSAATTVYYVPHVGRYVPLYNGTSWTMTDIGGELSQATTDSTKSPAACATNSNYDLFIWNDSGTYRCTRGPAWTSDTARGTGAGTTELERVAGILVNKIAITNGPAAQRGTYVGTIRTNGSSQVDYHLGGLGTGGVAAVLGVWNAHHRVDVTACSQDDTNTYTYATATWRPANNSTAYRISFVCGLAEDAIEAAYHAYAVATTSNALCGIGLDSTSTLSAHATPGAMNGSVILNIVASLRAPPQLGFHFVQAIERSQTTAGTNTYYGDAGLPGVYQAGLYAKLRM